MNSAHNSKQNLNWFTQEYTLYRVQIVPKEDKRTVLVPRDGLGETTRHEVTATVESETTGRASRATIL